MYENIGNKLDNNYNKINSNIYDFNKLNLLKHKFNYTSSTDFIYKNNKTFYNNKLIYNNNGNIKKYNLYLKKKNYDVKKDDEHFLLKKNETRQDNSLNYLNKDYNSLLDFNCSSYLLRKNILNHLTKHNFINQNGDVLEDPSNTLKSPCKPNVIKIDRAYYYNKYNNMYLNDTNYKKISKIS